MSQNTSVALVDDNSKVTAIGTAGYSDYVTINVAGQMFGIEVAQVQDVLGPQRITRIPLAPPEVAGALNLRGRIVTAIDVRTRLKLPPRDPEHKGMSVVVESRNELFSLIIDSVGEVLSVPQGDFEPKPGTLDPRWREVSSGIYRLQGKLLVILDVKELLGFTQILEEEVEA